MARTYTTHMEHGAAVRVDQDAGPIADIRIRIRTPDVSIYLSYAEAAQIATDLARLVNEAATRPEEQKQQAQQ